MSVDEFPGFRGLRGTLIATQGFAKGVKPDPVATLVLAELTGSIVSAVNLAAVADALANLRGFYIRPKNIRAETQPQGARRGEAATDAARERHGDAAKDFLAEETRSCR